MNKRQLSKYCITYFVGYIVFAMGYSQYIPYLQQLGFTTSQRGIMISGYAVTTILFQLFLGFLSDKYNKAKEIFMGAIVVGSLSTLILFSIETRIFILHLILIAISGGIINTNYGLMDSWLFTNGKEEVKKFSFIRAFGSAGWCFACLFTSLIINAVGYPRYGQISLIITIITCSLVQISNKKVHEDVEINKKTGVTKADIRELLSNKKYMILTIGLLFLTCATTTNGSVVVDKMISLGADNSAIGLKWAICGASEIPIYLIGSRLLERTDPYKLLIASGVIITIQYILFCAGTTVNAMLVVSMLQMFTGPLVMLASRILFYDYAPEYLKSTSILVSSSIYQGISMLVMPGLCGFISEYIGINISLMFVAVLAGVGLIFTIKLRIISMKKLVLKST